MRNMNALLRELAIARQKQFEAEQAYKDAFERFLQGEGGRLKTAAEGAKGYAEILETAVRTAAVEHYQETGDAHPTPALSIRMVTKLHYEPAQVLDWAIETYNYGILGVDEKKLKALAQEEDIPRDVARLDKTPTPYLASDLSAYLHLPD